MFLRFALIRMKDIGRIESEIERLSVFGVRRFKAGGVVLFYAF